MKNTDLLSAIGKIDEKYINAEKTASKSKRAKNVFNVIKIASAAVFCAAVIGALWFVSYKNVINPQSGTDPDTSVTDDGSALSSDVGTSDTDGTPDKTDPVHTTAFLIRCFDEYLGGRTEANRYSATGHEITQDKYINIDFCVKLDVLKYAAVYSIDGTPAEDFSEKEVDISGYKFKYKNGLRLSVIDDGDVTDIENASLTDGEVKTVYDAYKKYLDCMDHKLITSAFYLCSKCGAGEYLGYDLSYAYYVNGAFIGLFNGEGTGVWTERIAGLDFIHDNSGQFVVLRKEKECEGLKAAYEQGMLSTGELDLLYTAYTATDAASVYTSYVKTNEFSIKFGDGEGEIGSVGNKENYDNRHTGMFTVNGDVCIVDFLNRRVNKYGENGDFKGAFSLKNGDTKSILSCAYLNGAYYTTEDNKIYRYTKEDEPELIYEGREGDVLSLSASTEYGCDYTHLYIKNIYGLYSIYKFYEDGSKTFINNFDNLQKQYEKMFSHSGDNAWDSLKLISYNSIYRAVVEKRYAPEPDLKSYIYLYWPDGTEITRYENGDDDCVYAGAYYAFNGNTVYALNVKEDRITVVQIKAVESR